jgi:hypothetical protein
MADEASATEARIALLCTLRKPRCWRHIPPDTAGRRRDFQVFEKRQVFETRSSARVFGHRSWKNKSPETRLQQKFGHA